MGKSSAPKPPDPAQVAQAQTATNIGTATANAALGNVNQRTPYGDLTYSSENQFITDPSGETYYRGPNGEIKRKAPTRSVTTASPGGQGGYGREWYKLPESQREGLIASGQDAQYRNSGGGGSSTSQQPLDGWEKVSGYYLPQYTATQTLSKAEQKIFNRESAARKNLAQLAKDQSGRLGDLLDRPVELGNDATESRLMELGMSRLGPQLDQRRDREATRLANQGIGLGSKAYDRAMTGVDEGENDALNQLLLSGRSLANQEILTERNQPLNEIIALLSGSQVNQPNFVNTSMPQMPTVDRAGLEQQGYQNKLGAWQQQQDNQRSIMGSLFKSLSPFMPV